MSTALKKKPVHSNAHTKTLLDLELNDCRWPIGEPRSPDFHFCGDQRAPGRPYCEHHWGMAFQPARPRNHGQRPPEFVVIAPPAAKAA